MIHALGLGHAHGSPSSTPESAPIPRTLSSSEIQEPSIPHNSKPQATLAGELREDVEALVSIRARSVQHIGQLNKAAQWLEAQFARSGGRVSVQEYEDQRGQMVRNVIVSFGPEDGRRLIVGAHYDTEGVLGPQAGADDNASGVAGLLALARRLGETELKSRVDLVAFTLEEPPYFGSELMGSAMHARYLREQGIDVDGMIALEMIGYFSDAPGSQRYPELTFLPGVLQPIVQPLVDKLGTRLYGDRGDFIGVVGALGDNGFAKSVQTAMIGANEALPVKRMNAPRFLGQAFFSDHRHYQDFGGLMITDTAFMRNDNYHTLGDTPDTLDYDRMAKVVRQVTHAVIDRANRE